MYYIFCGLSLAKRSIFVFDRMYSIVYNIAVCTSKLSARQGEAFSRYYKVLVANSVSAKFCAADAYSFRFSRLCVL